jgi:molecular chaperone GrpE
MSNETEQAKTAKAKAAQEKATDGKNAAGSMADESAEAPPELPPATAEERVAALEAERNEAKDRMLRIAAEFENWKKRARVTQSEAEASARERVLRDMLEVADNLERATEHAGDGSVDGPSILKGVTLVLRLLQQKLERHEVRPFDAKGQPFDPRLHEAISRIESPDVPSGAVAVEMQKGYRIGDKLLRPAMVSVSTGPAAAGQKTEGAGKDG